MRRTLCIVVLLSSTPVLAQPAATDRIAAQIGRCLIQLEGQADAVAVLQAKLDKANAELKELKDAKQKPSPSPPHGGSGTQP